MKRREISTWDDFVQKFTETFIIAEDTTSKWKKMVDRVQKRDERLASYFHEKVKLCADLKLNVNESKKQVLVGLWSKQACDAMFARNHYTTDQLFHDLLDYEQMEKERTSRVMYKNHPKPMTQENKEKGYENKRDNTVPTDKNKETINQRRSSKPYLPARNEENKPLCFACNKYGHVSKYCSENQRQVLVTNTVMSRSIVLRTRGKLKYFQEATLNGNPIKSYVDLGSQCVMIREADANVLNVKIEPLDKPMQIRGFGEGALTPIGKFNALLKKQDSEIRDIVEILNKETKNTEEEKRVGREYEIRDGRLFKKDMDNVLWVVPKRARWQITKKWHDDIGHPALGKTLAKIKENFWWPRMRNYVKGYIGTCIECLYNKVPGGKRQVEGFTKFTMLKPARNTTSIVTAKVLDIDSNC
ncbi:Integrase zinc binding domain [Popillia japonica]|uniref:RNA-directed DNA polymerase n=1 Tax=Popillia japonica TaxID=7064 RepID=A0AAW1IXI9_POPJA